jgi:hypothetical protein
MKIIHLIEKTPVLDTLCWKQNDGSVSLTEELNTEEMYQIKSQFLQETAKDIWEEKLNLLIKYIDAVITKCDYL